MSNTSNIAALRHLLQQIKDDLYCRTTLTLNKEDRLLCEIVAYEGEVALFSAKLNLYRAVPCLTLRWHGDAPFTVHTDQWSTYLSEYQPLLYRYAVKVDASAAPRSLGTINVPAWFAEPVFRQWLDAPTQRCFTYHRADDPFGEYSDVIIMLDGQEGDCSDMPEWYWRQVVQAGTVLGVTALRLTNLQD